MLLTATKDVAESQLSVLAERAWPPAAAESLQVGVADLPDGDVEPVEQVRHTDHRKLPPTGGLIEAFHTVRLPLSGATITRAPGRPR